MSQNVQNPELNINPSVQFNLSLDNRSALAIHSKPVPQDETNFRQAGILLDEMWKVMYIKKGIGLAANQLGMAMQIFIMDCQGVKEEFINPQWLRHWGGKKNSHESCLSFPGQKAVVSRWFKVALRYQDRYGREKKVKLKGLTAYVAQHEMDHLIGVTIGKKL